MEKWLIYLIVVIGILILTLLIVFLIIKNFIKINKYDKWTIDIDVSNKRVDDYDEIIDLYICRNHSMFAKSVNSHVNLINSRYLNNKEKINNSKLFKKRKSFYLHRLEKAFDYYRIYFVTFNFYRRQTRYRQKNYVKTPYTIDVKVSSLFYNLDALKEKFSNLSNINFETSLRKYDSKNQRKLMTKQLRDLIARRDNYTCQICGKYMPDGVGLQIDHIIPLARGGKTVESNLRVLCDKCNLKRKK